MDKLYVFVFTVLSQASTTSRPPCAFAPSAEVRGFEPRSGQVKSETLTPVASLVSVHYLRYKTGLVGPVSV